MSIRPPSRWRRALCLSGVLALVGGCDLITEAIVDGALDFVETRTAELLEHAIPPPGGEEMSGGG